jgi:hypothetical protein
MAIAPVLALCFFLLMHDSKANTASNIGLENVQMILTPVYLDEEVAMTVLDSHNSLLDLYPTPLLIQLVEGDDVVLEARNEKDTGEFDFLPCLASECHGPETLDWNQGPIVEVRGPLHRV